MEEITVLQPDVKELVLTFNQAQQLYFDHGNKLERRIRRDLHDALIQGHAHNDGYLTCGGAAKLPPVPTERIVFVLYNDLERIERGQSCVDCVII